MKEIFKSEFLTIIENGEYLEVDVVNSKYKWKERFFVKPKSIVGMKLWQNTDKEEDESNIIIYFESGPMGDIGVKAKIEESEEVYELLKEKIFK
jgi:hypothetical protein